MINNNEEQCSIFEKSYYFPENKEFIATLTRGTSGKPFTLHCQSIDWCRSLTSKEVEGKIVLPFLHDSSELKETFLSSKNYYTLTVKYQCQQYGKESGVFVISNMKFTDEKIKIGMEDRLPELVLKFTGVNQHGWEFSDKPEGQVLD